MAADFRQERDSMGPVDVPSDRYWGAQTQRSLQHFTVGLERMPMPVIHAYGRIKRAAARVNAALGQLEPDVSDLVVRAATEVVDGQLDDHFPLFVWQTGSGTQSNMNVNEVIANRAIALAGGTLGSKTPVHPNDHVNRGQSSNDTFPTAMYVASRLEIDQRLAPAIIRVRDTLAGKRDALMEVVKIGRTHLQDATPLTIGQEISGWVALLDSSLTKLHHAAKDLESLAFGGTAVGTGLNAAPGFADQVCAALAEETGVPFVSAANKFAALSAHDAMVEVHGSLKTLATSATKIANDVRFLSSGPRCGLGELIIPANEPGSSIMPGKVNPTQCESLLMVCAQVMGNDATMGIAGASGNFELNVQKPLMAHLLLQSVRLLADALDNFDVYCAQGIEVDRARVDAYVERSLMLVTALAPHLGYDEAAAIAKEAHHHGLSLRQAALAAGVNEADFDRWVDPRAMTGI